MSDELAALDFESELGDRATVNPKHLANLIATALIERCRMLLEAGEMNWAIVLEGAEPDGSYVVRVGSTPIARLDLSVLDGPS